MLILTLCLGMTLSVSAEDTEGFANDYCRVQDMAGLMTDSEEAKLNGILDELSIRQKMDVVVVTTNTLDEKTVQEYADDIYDYGNFGYGPDKDGILLLISLGEENDCYICIVICIDSAVYKFDEDLLGKLLRTGKTYDCTLCYYGWNYAYDISSDSYMYSKSDKAC